jgi:hypothetical protein
MEICPCCNREKTSLEIKKIKLRQKLDQIKEEREISERFKAKQKKKRIKRKKRNEKKRIDEEKEREKQRRLKEDDEIVNRFSDILKSQIPFDKKIELSLETINSIKCI